MARVGVAVVLFVFSVGAGSGCGESSRRLECPRSVAAFCSGSGVACSLTWDDVQAGPAMCWIDDTYEISACGGYRRLIYRGTDSGASFYYDAASGQLVAIVGVGGVGSITRECIAGPPGGFDEPSCGLPDGAAPIECGADGIVM